MANQMRFGRRIALPSTRQIRHDLLTLMVEEDARLKAAEDRTRAADVAPTLPPAAD